MLLSVLISAVFPAPDLALLLLLLLSVLPLVILTAPSSQAWRALHHADTVPAPDPARLLLPHPVLTAKHLCCPSCVFTVGVFVVVVLFLIIKYILCFL